MYYFPTRTHDRTNNNTNSNARMQRSQKRLATAATVFCLFLRSRSCNLRRRPFQLLAVLHYKKERMNSSTQELFVAAKENNQPEVERLLSVGADVNAEDEGWTPLHVACYNGHVQVVDQGVAGAWSLHRSESR
jgi:ankyrin repeat protein